ncbi:zinc finger, CCHC-type, retrotransposon gag domain protein [Tanacetum coccineum]
MDVAQVANVGRNMELFHERGGANNQRGYDQRRSDRRSYDRQDNSQRGNDGRSYDRQGDNGSQRSYQQNRDQQYNRSSRSSSQKEYLDYTSSPPCETCGKLHPGRACYKVTGACFSCGSTRHMVRDCPKKSRDGDEGSRDDK